MKNTFYFLHNLIQSKEYRISFFNNLRSAFNKLKHKFPYVLTLLYPLLIFCSLYISLKSFLDSYLASIISVVVLFIFAILLSIPSFYLIRGVNLFDINKIVEGIIKVKTKTKNYHKLNEDQLKKLNKLYNKDARKYFDTSKFDYETFKILINNISERNFNSKIYLNEETKVKNFVAFINELFIVTNYDYVDICKIFQFYIKGEYVDLNYDTVKVKLSEFRKLTKNKIN